MIEAMPDERLSLSIITPTYKEAANLRPLTERIFGVLKSTRIDAELLIVDDDSRDGTERVVASLKREFPVRLIVRHGQRGLGSAVVEGFSQARFDRFLVLDADLQHPPESIPAMVEQLERDDHDFVIGTRYGPGGAVVEDWPFLRRLTSRTAGLLARPLTPLSDPMAGFFALHRATWQRADRLNPIGYKIALELYVKCRCRNAAEVPIIFQTRIAGDSKLNVAEQVRYLRQIVGLYRFRFPWLLPTLAALFLALAALLWAKLTTI